MRYYFAPMECITGYLFRNAHAKYFTAADKYFSPFISAGKRRMNQREREDILPEHNGSVCLVPQILTNCREDFLEIAEELREYGYREVNLNLGCPSRGVAAKGRGSGFLKDREKLEEFLDGIFEKCRIQVSVKTRLGVEEPEEFGQLLELFNRYPIKELIIHPRVQKDYYRKPLHLEWFRMAVQESRIPLCYNGDLFCAEKIRAWRKEFPEVECAMLGRGLVANPELIGEAKGERKVTREGLLAFHDEVYAGYLDLIGDPKKVLPKMKELWCYWQYLFPDSAQSLADLKQARAFPQYEQAVRKLLEGDAGLTLSGERGFRPPNAE